MRTIHVKHVQSGSGVEISSQKQKAQGFRFRHTAGNLDAKLSILKSNF